MVRLGALSLPALLLVFAGGCGPRFDAPPIILVDIDTLRADHLGCYGYQRRTSPHIDRFSEEAVRFHWAFSQAPNTPPSQASIFTSLYPTTHGQIGDQTALSQDVVTLAEVLEAQGYTTAAFVDGGLMARGCGLEQGFSIYDDEAGGVGWKEPKVRKWIEEHLRKAARTYGRGERQPPFFLLFHTYDVHSPYEDTPPPLRDLFLDGFAMPTEAFMNNMSARMREVWDARYRNDPPRLSREEMDYAVAMYDSGIRQVDDWFGRFVRFLKKKGIYDQAILVVLSDHGDEFQEHEGLFHEKIYATVTRIPLLIKFPESRRRGVFYDVVESIDLMPTLLEEIGVAGPSVMQGESLLPIIEGKKRPVGLAVSESPYLGRRIAITTESHRLFYTQRTGAVELYAYREDPREQNDLSAEQAAVVASLSEAIERWEKRAMAERFSAGATRELRQETIEQLRTLGYLD